MIIVYALPVIEDCTMFTFREFEINLESKMWNNAMLEMLSCGA